MNAKTRTFVILLVISMPLVVVGALFKIMHWPGANMLLMAGIVMWFVTLAYLIYYVVSRRQVAPKDEV